MWKKQHVMNTLVIEQTMPNAKILHIILSAVGLYLCEFLNAAIEQYFRKHKYDKGDRHNCLPKKG